MVRAKNAKLVSILQNVLLFLLCIVTLFPFAVMLSTAFKDMKEIRSASMTLLPKVPTLVRFQTILSESSWMRYFYNSF